MRSERDNGRALALKNEEAHPVLEDVLDHRQVAAVDRPA
jgi:hypothetical protein